LGQDLGKKLKKYKKQIVKKRKDWFAPIAGEREPVRMASWGRYGLKN